MKFNLSKPQKVSRDTLNGTFAYNKAEAVRRATEAALTQFSKTFAALAKYDRTEKARR